MGRQRAGASALELPRDRASARSAAGWWLVYLAITAVPAIILILQDANGGRAAYDSTIYHERVIREYATSLPSPDLTNPLTTTIPGYHLLLAGVARLASDHIMLLRLVSLSLGIAFLVVTARALGRWAGTRNGLLLAMPLAACSYVLGSSAWLLPDNLSWLFVTLLLVVSIEATDFRRWILSSGAIVLAAVACRQVNIWLSAVVVATAVAGGWPTVDDHLRARLRRGAVAVAAMLPSLALLGWFARLWGGLTPPRFQEDVSGMNLATPGFLLFQFTALGFFFLPWLIGPILRFARERPAWAAGVALAGLAIAAVPSTAPGEQWGRFAGWWRLMERFPIIGGHSSLPIALAAPFGAVALVASIAALGRRERVVLSVAVASFGAAMTCTYYSWQRYHEPFILVLLAMLASLQWRGKLDPRSAIARFGAISALTAVLAGLTYSNFSGGRVERDEPPARFHLSPAEREAWKCEEWDRTHPGTRQSRELKEIRGNAGR